MIVPESVAASPNDSWLLVANLSVLTQTPAAVLPAQEFLEGRWRWCGSR